MQVRIAICDDQAECRQLLVSSIRGCIQSMGIVTDTYKDGLSFLKEYGKHEYDLLFLDIEMPQLDGIALAKRLRAMRSEVPIVFLTSHIEYALEGYEVNALRYLTKPIRTDKLREVLCYVAEQMAKQRSLWLKTDLGEEKVSVSDVLYMEAQNQNIMISTKTGSYCVRYNMADYETELEADGFFRIHRGYLISLGHVKSIGKNEVTMDDSTVLPVSRSKDKALKEALFQYIRKEAI